MPNPGLHSTHGTAGTRRLSWAVLPAEPRAAGRWVVELCPSSPVPWEESWLTKGKREQKGIHLSLGHQGRTREGKTKHHWASVNPLTTKIPLSRGKSITSRNQAASGWRKVLDPAKPKLDKLRAELPGGPMGAGWPSVTQAPLGQPHSRCSCQNSSDFKREVPNLGFKGSFQAFKYWPNFQECGQTHLATC